RQALALLCLPAAFPSHPRQQCLPARRRNAASDCRWCGNPKYSMLPLCWGKCFNFTRGRRGNPFTAYYFQKSPEFSGESTCKNPVWDTDFRLSKGKRKTNSPNIKPCYTCQHGHALVIGGSYNRQLLNTTNPISFKPWFSRG
uniref:Uncharacterized protein n=1 Tax=Apteryx owenii TaxID=8824 RepID=A0A8B9PYV9_APTOW